MKKADSRFVVIGAFAAVYLIWGSTYLAIRLLVDTLPGFTMVGLRFGLAGLLLYAWARWRGISKPNLRQLKEASFVGMLLLTVGTGAVVWAVGFLHTGLVALLIATEPLWVALFMAVQPGGSRGLSRRTLFALGVGFCGTVVLVAPSGSLGHEGLHLPAVLAVLLGSLCWAGGSVYSRHAELPTSPWMNTAVQMLAGGAMLIVVGAVRGELASFEPQRVSLVSLAAFLYLIVFGSLVAFSAYTWLVRTIEPTLVSTHTYVNPVVAILLGWWIASEPIGAKTLAASALILGSVVLMTWPRKPRRLCADGASRSPA